LTNLKPGELISDDLIMKIRLLLDPFNNTVQCVLPKEGTLTGQVSGFMERITSFQLVYER
jgi:hypothetical protein